MEKKLEEINEEISLKFDADLKDYSTIHIGGKAKFLFEVYSTVQLYRVYVWCIIHNIKVKVIGLGANLIFDDNGYNGAIIVNKTSQILWRKNCAYVTSGMPVSKLIYLAQSKELSGIENLSGIPATVGGAITNNLGAFDVSFANFVEYVTCIDTKKLQQYLNQKSQTNSPIHNVNKDLQIGIKISKIIDDINTINLNSFKACVVKIKKEDCAFEYRNSIFKNCLNRYVILKCKMKFVESDYKAIQQKIESAIQKKMSSQPLDYPSAGSVFKRIYVDKNHNFEINNNNLNSKINQDKNDLQNDKLSNKNKSQNNNLSNHDKNNLKNVQLSNKNKSQNYSLNENECLYPAKIIDELGLKGFSVGGAQISTKHAGFIINTGNASQKDFVFLTKKIQNQIRSHYHLTPQFEVEFVPY